MARLNEHYLKLAGGYLFPEIGRRISLFAEADPAAAKRIIHCGIGDVTEPLPAAAIEAMKRAADELGSRETFRGYGPSPGYEFIRNAIVEHDFRARGIHVDPDEVFVSDGSKGDCGSILEILGAGNRVAVSDPVYPVYVDTNVMAGMTGPATDDGGYEGIVYLPGTPENDFIPAPPAAAASVADPFDLIYLCYPNNPTGSMIDHEKLRAWVDYALEHDALILYDVAYKAFIREASRPHSIYEVPEARRCAIEFHSFSKNGGFTGVRCGYTVCPKEVAATTSEGRRLPLHDLWVRRFNTRTNGVSYPVQRAAEALYSPEGKKQVSGLTDHYMENARIVREGCEAMGLRVWGGVNAPYIWVTCPAGRSSWETFDLLLREANIVVVPGVGFGRRGEGFFRISAFNSRAKVKEAVCRLEALLAPTAGRTG